MLPFLHLTLLFHQAKFDGATQWNAVDTAIRSRYYARISQKEKMTKLLEKYGVLARKTTDSDGFSDVVNQMITEFGDSHFALYTTRDQGFYVMDALLKDRLGKDPVLMPSVGAWFKKTSQGYVTQMVVNGTEAEKAGLRIGDSITQINGVPFTPVLSLTPLLNSYATLNVKRGDSSIALKMNVRNTSALEMFLQGSRDSSRIIESNGKKYGYFHLWTQASAKFAEALETAMAGKLRQSDAMILDLRDGFGGRPEKMADPFFRPDVKIDWDMGGGGYQQSFGYQKPLVVLINQGSRSAKEILSFILQKSKRATLIGKTTAGNVLGTFPQALGDWGYLEIPMIDVKADGVRLEGIGVSPDIAVSVEYDKNGKDLVIDRALQFLNQGGKELH